MASSQPWGQERQPLSTLGLFALGVGGFSVGTGEFAIMGLLPDAAADIGVSLPEAGNLVSAYAIGVMLGAPLLAVFSAGCRRRSLLIALMAFYAAGNFATALVPGYLPIASMRVVSGLPHATYFGVAALVAATLASPHQRARAVGLVMLGLTTAMLVGAPTAAWLGMHVGWRSAFIGVGFCALFAMLLIRCGVPDLPASKGASPLLELAALRRPQVWMTLAIAGIGFGGMFCVFSYIAPTLVEVTGIGVKHVPLVLVLFGVGSVAGNLIGARLADRALLPTIGGVLIYSAVLLASFGTLVGFLPTALLAVCLLGGIVALGPALQIRLMDVAGEAQTLAAALNHSAFNFANALGAWLGGVSIAAGWGWGSLGWIGASLMVAGLLVFCVSLKWTR